FLEMDVIDRAGTAFRSSLNAPDDAVFRLVIISRTGATPHAPTTMLLSDNLISVDERAGPKDYDPRQRPWYIDAFRREGTFLTGPTCSSQRACLAIRCASH